MRAAARQRPATYQDVLDAPEDAIAELIDGELSLQPRPGGPHASVAAKLTVDIGGPFDRGRNGPGGWILLVEPEIHLGGDVLVPDLAGWRRSRMPKVTPGSHFTLAPDWVCEILSKKTARLDRAVKMPIYWREGVAHAWLIDPSARTLEVFRRQDAGASWSLLGVFGDEGAVRAEPFDAVDLDVAGLWADIADDDEPPGAGA